MIEIGSLLPADRQRWTELWRTYLDFYDTTLSPEILEHTWARILIGDEVRGFAAREDG